MGRWTVPQTLSRVMGHPYVVWFVIRGRIVPKRLCGRSWGELRRGISHRKGFILPGCTWAFIAALFAGIGATRETLRVIIRTSGTQKRYQMARDDSSFRWFGWGFSSSAAVSFWVAWMCHLRLRCFIRVSAERMGPSLRCNCLPDVFQNLVSCLSTLTCALTFPAAFLSSYSLSGPTFFFCRGDSLAHSAESTLDSPCL